MAQHAHAQHPALPSPPFHTIPNINNLRDSAASLSLQSDPTKKIRSGLFFRSAEPSGLTPAGWAALKDLGISTIFDLRSESEVFKGWATQPTRSQHSASTTADADQDHNPQIPAKLPWMQDLENAGLHRAWVPVFAAEDYSPERLAQRFAKYMDESTEGFVRAYGDILEHAGPAFHSILMYLARLGLEAQVQAGERAREMGEGAEGRGILVHCTAGKDRTGAFFGVLFDFLGVERQSIADEYQLTELGLASIRSGATERLLQSPAFLAHMNSRVSGRTWCAQDVERQLEVEAEGGKGDEVLSAVLADARAGAERMIGSRRESMLGMLEMVDRVWGGSEAYLRSVVGLRDGELEALRRGLVVGV